MGEALRHPKREPVVSRMGTCTAGEVLPGCGAGLVDATWSLEKPHPPAHTIRPLARQTPMTVAAIRVGLLLLSSGVRSLAAMALLHVFDRATFRTVGQFQNLSQHKAGHDEGKSGGVCIPGSVAPDDNYGRIANARAGKPRPFFTFGQATMISAPFAGTWSRFPIPP